MKALTTFFINLAAIFLVSAVAYILGLVALAFWRVVIMGD